MADPVPGTPAKTSLPSTASPTPKPPNTIFRGPSGIRAGWRLLIYLAMVAVLVVLLGIVVAAIAHGRTTLVGVSQATPLGTGLGEVVIFLLAALPALVMARIERRKWGAYGLPLRWAFRSHFWIGSLVGFLAISSCLLGIYAFHGFRLIGLEIHGKAILLAAIAWGAAFIAVGLGEEFAFRGYLQYTLTTGMGFWPSAILLSALFGLAHGWNPGETKAGLVSVVLFGLLFCLFLRRTGNLWWAVGFHAGWDWGQTFFYGVPDSGALPYQNLFNCAFSGKVWLTGGTVGPEASVFTPVVLVIVAILFAQVYRESRYQVAEAGSRTSDLGGQAPAQL